MYYLKANEKGLIQKEDLERLLNRPRTAVASCESTLVSVMFANNEIGTIQP